MNSQNAFLKNEKLQQYILIFIILIVAFVLRAYNYFNIPYTHDELSMLFRTGYRDLFELIDKGVIMDGHPAGVQIFINYYILLFGDAEWVVKLPFLLFGIASIWLIYLIANFCFSKTSAVVTATFLATLQFPIMYSQIARPYISGLFFILLMTYFWLKYFFDPDIKYQKRFLVGFIIAGILCSYNHYFSLLSAVVIGITGIFFLNKKNAIPYILSGCLIFLAFLPHLNIFFIHLSNEGLGWLSKPTSDFFGEYLGYILHFSWLTYILIAAIAGMSIYHVLRSESKFNKLQLVFLIWFLLPLLIGYLYSIYFKPVLQFSVLIFSFPFLLLFLFSFLPQRSYLFNIAIVALIAAINIYTLIVERQHYQVFYNMQPIQQFAENSELLSNKLGGDAIHFYIDQNPKYLGYYWNKKDLNAGFTSIYNADISPVEFRKMVHQHPEPYLAAGVLPQEYYNIIEEKYPYLIYRDIGLGYEYYGYSRLKPDNIIDNIGYQKSIDPGKAFLDSTEWSPGLKMPLSEMRVDIYSIIDISADVQSTGKLENALLCCNIKSEKDEIWMSAPLSRYVDEKNPEWQKAYLSFRMTHVVKDFKDIAEGEMNIFIWNKDLESLQVKELTVKVREGNPYVYVLTSDFN